MSEMERIKSLSSMIKNCYKNNLLAKERVILYDVRKKLIELQSKDIINHKEIDILSLKVFEILG